MDTKLKKSDKLRIIKLICILLALVFSACGTLFSVQFLKTDFGMGGDTYISGFQLLTSAVNSDNIIYHNTDFYEECRKFANLASKSVTIYHSNSKEDYVKYKNEYRNTYKVNLLQVLLSESNKSFPFFTFYCLDKGYISLEKLGDNANSYLNDYCYYNNESLTWQDNYIFEKKDEQNHFTETTSVSSDNGKEDTYVQNIIYFDDALSNLIENNYYYSEEIYQYNNLKYGEGKPTTSLLVKAEEGNFNGLANISNVYYGEDEELFNGWYAIKINESKLTPTDPFGGFYQYQATYFGNYDDYKNMVKSNRESLSEYQNIFFAVYDERNNKLVSSTIPDTNENSTLKELKNIVSSYSYKFSYYPESSSVSNDFEQAIYSGFQSDIRDIFKNNRYCLFIVFDETFSSGNVDSLYTLWYNSETIRSIILKDVFPWSIICSLGILICLIVLSILSGKTSGDNQRHFYIGDGMFPEIRTLIDFLFIGLLIFLISGYFNTFFSLDDNPGILILLVCMITLCVIDFITFHTRKIKLKMYFKSLIIVWIFEKLKLLFFKIKKAYIQYLINRKKYDRFLADVVKKVVLFLLLPDIMFLYLIGFDGFQINEFDVVVMCIAVIYNTCFAVYAVKSAYRIKEIFATLHEIRYGNLDVKIDTSSLPSYCVAYAQDLNAVSDGIKIAVNKAIQEEKTKAELITNVSHDLKTPLTSIISYVDLLKKCSIQDEEAQKYLEVLGQKSNKLKKLIEDLIEASKASTGAIEAIPIKMNLNELLYQIVGEYEDELLSRNIQIVFNKEETDCVIFADSKLSHRVLDNLFVNIKKYALNSTRVYIDKEIKEKRVTINISNISEKPLNISAKELMERFTRGDESRSSDGNGLGLSIAQSLMEIQKGNLELEINGDMFTAKVTFPTQ